MNILLHDFLPILHEHTHILGRAHFMPNARSCLYTLYKCQSTIIRNIEIFQGPLKGTFMLHLMLSYFLFQKTN